MLVFPFLSFVVTLCMGVSHLQSDVWPGKNFRDKTLLSNNYGIVGNTTYDYIILGGGTAGLAIAHRLAEDGIRTVAVIEAGGFSEFDNGNASIVPAYCPEYGATTAASANQFPLIDWGFITQPQDGLGGRQLHYGRGKTLGGSSAQNAMIYNRGTIGSFQAWAELVGDQSWTFENLLPHFSRGIHYSPADMELRAKNASVPLPKNPKAYNETGGPLQVSHPNFAQVFSSFVDHAMRESGVSEQQDFSSGFLLGSQYAPLTIRYPEEERASSASTYLRASLSSGRTNLKIYHHTLVKKIIFDGKKTAIGAQVETASFGNSNTFVLQARNEVIVSAGAFQSPQLLMVSGIGPRAQLEVHGIPVIADRPGVGANMQDHLDFAPIFYTNLEYGVGSDVDPATRAASEESYITNRTGPLTNAGVDYIGWEKLPEPYRSNLSASAKSDLARYPADWPELEYEVTGAHLVGTDASKRYGTIITIPVTPLSRGWVNITSADTRDLPLINPNQLSHPTDRELAVQGFKRARSFFATEAMKPILEGEYAPGENITSDEDILQYIMASSYQNWHASCTCRMGKIDDPLAVVDSRARVIGVQRLRVVDASSFALLPPGHPESTVYVLAEKIASDILDPSDQS